MIVERLATSNSVVRGSAGVRSGRFLKRSLCAAILVLAAFRPGGPVAAFNSFNAFTSLEDAAGMTIVSDRDEGSDLIDPIPPNTAFTSFIGGGNFNADAYVDTNADHRRGSRHDQPPRQAHIVCVFFARH